MNKKILILLIPILSLITSSCSFNIIPTKSDEVLLVNIGNIQGCQRIGSTLVKVQDKIIGIPLPKSQIKKYLINQAKKDASQIEGDSIVRLSPLEGGFQSFAIYRCN
jgi:hypothetical protein